MFSLFDSWSFMPKNPLDPKAWNSGTWHFELISWKNTKLAVYIPSCLYLLLLTAIFDSWTGGVCCSELERRIWRATCVGTSFTTLFSNLFFVSLFSLMIVFHDQLSILHTSGYESVPPLQGTKCDVREGKDVKDLVAFAQESLKYIDIWVLLQILPAALCFLIVIVKQNSL